MAVTRGAAEPALRAQAARHDSLTADATAVQDALYRITDMASTAGDLPEFYAGIHQIVRRLTHAENFFLVLYDADRKLLNFAYHVDEVDTDFPDPDVWEPMGTAHARGLTAYVLRTGVAQHVPRSRWEELIADGEVAPSGVQGVDWIGVPLKADEWLIGALVVQTYETEQAYTENDVELLTFVGQHIASALSRARANGETKRLLAESNQRAAELEIVNEVGRALSKQLDFGQVVEAVGDRTAMALGLRGLSISIVDSVTDELTFYYWIDEGIRRNTMERIVLGDELSLEILRKNRPVRIGSAEEAAARGTPFKVGGTSSYVGVPIPAGDKAIGVFAIGTREPHAYSESEERILTTLASTMGVALENARLFAEMERAKEAAEAANEAKGTFLASVSHELRTPLTSVLGFAKVITRQLDERIFPNVDASDPKTERAMNQVRDNMTVIVTEGERLSTLVNNVLDLAKIEAGRFEWHMQQTSLAEVIDRAMAMTSGFFDNKGVKLRRDVADDLPEVTGDRDALLQVVINLLTNAIKFTDRGSVTVSAKTGDEGVVVRVTDTGLGISSADQERVFEKFTQVGGDTLTDRPHGTGLGLPICREIVEAHGGRIWVESKLGKGSTFAFVLPVSQPDAST